MRLLVFGILSLLLGLFMQLMPQPLAAQDTPGQEPERISRASALEEKHGAVILSIRSELFLRAKLNVYFVREGGRVENDADIVRFSRSQSVLAFGNTTTKYKPRTIQLPAGRYRLVGYGVKCIKIPKPDERCLVDIKLLGSGETVSFPSRGYTDDAPVFEVAEGALTVVGDFGLTARNTLEWSEIPQEKLTRVLKKFQDLPRMPDPQIAQQFRLQFPLRPRSFEDDRGRRY